MVGGCSSPSLSLAEGLAQNILGGDSAQAQREAQILGRAFKHSGRSPAKLLATNLNQAVITHATATKSTRQGEEPSPSVLKGSFFPILMVGRFHPFRWGRGWPKTYKGESARRRKWKHRFQKPDSVRGGQSDHSACRAPPDTKSQASGLASYNMALESKRHKTNIQPAGQQYPNPNENRQIAYSVKHTLVWMANRGTNIPLVDLAKDRAQRQADRQPWSGWQNRGANHTVSRPRSGRTQRQAYWDEPVTY